MNAMNEFIYDYSDMIPKKREKRKFPKIKIYMGCEILYLGKRIVKRDRLKVGMTVYENGGYSNIKITKVDGNEARGQISENTTCTLEYCEDRKCWISSSTFCFNPNALINVQVV